MFSTFFCKKKKKNKELIKQLDPHSNGKNVSMLTRKLYYLNVSFFDIEFCALIFQNGVSLTCDYNYPPKLYDITPASTYSLIDRTYSLIPKVRHTKTIIKESFG